MAPNYEIGVRLVASQARLPGIAVEVHRKGAGEVDLDENNSFEDLQGHHLEVHCAFDR
jgi:hypothetical protein